MRFVIETGGNEENMCVGSLHDQKGKTFKRRKEYILVIL